MRFEKNIIAKFLLVVFLCSTSIIKAQENEVQNLPKYDHQFFHPGFLLGFNIAHFRVQPIDDFRFRDTVFSVTPHGVAGLNLGIIFGIVLGPHFDLRFIPALAFTQRNLEYNLIYPDSAATSESIIKQVESTYLEFPLELKLKSVRIFNYRVYAVGGFKYGIDMISQAKVLAKDKEIVKLNRIDYGYTVGVGFDFFLTYFKFSPELKMFTGLPNLLVQDNRTFSRPLKGLYSKTFMISFLFE